VYWLKANKSYSNCQPKQNASSYKIHPQHNALSPQRSPTISATSITFDNSRNRSWCPLTALLTTSNNSNSLYSSYSRKNQIRFSGHFVSSEQSPAFCTSVDAPASSEGTKRHTVRLCGFRTARLTLLVPESKSSWFPGTLLD
jgi:hypothetical protein